MTRILCNYFSTNQLAGSAILTILSVLCLGQLGPITDNKTGRNMRELSTPRNINIKIDLKNVENIYDLQKPNKLMPTTVEIAELKIGKPTRVVALKARVLRSPLPTLAKKACTMCALKSIQKPMLIISSIIVIELNDKLQTFIKPTIPTIIDTFLKNKNSIGFSSF